MKLTAKDLPKSEVYTESWSKRRLPGPVLYYGGKGSYQLPRLTKIIPYGNSYIEPYGGAASVLFTRKPSNVEVYNDLNIDMVNLLRVIKSGAASKDLYCRAFLTLYSFREYLDALAICKDLRQAYTLNTPPSVEWAWAYFTQQNQGYGGISTHPGNWGRALTDDKGVAKKVRTYTLRVDRLPRQHQRLTSVHILNEDALNVIEEYDEEGAVIYLDPPYVSSTRVNKKVYEWDQVVEHHRELVDLILGARSAIVLSGYDHEVYGPLMDAGWEKLEFSAYSSAAARNRTARTRGEGSLLKHASRVEVVWRNPVAAGMLPIKPGTGGAN